MKLFGCQPSSSRVAESEQRGLTYDEVDVKELRQRLKLSQPKFAALMDVPVGTLRNWEQNRRRPEGPARALLRVVAKHPEAVLDALR